MRLMLYAIAAWFGFELFVMVTLFALAAMEDRQRSRAISVARQVTPGRGRDHDEGVSSAT